MNTILVTGAAGYIGSFASRRLVQLGYKVVALDNLTTGFKESLPPECIFVEGDLRDEKLLKDVFSAHNINSILHFAAKASVPESVAHPELYYDNNFRGSEVLFRSAIAAGVKRFIFSSTAAVYAPTLKELIDEDSALGPINPYGESKLMTEKLLLDLNRKENISFIALRYFNVAGACLKNEIGQKTKNATHLIKVVAELATGKRKYIDVFGTDYATSDGSAVRDYIHVEDLVEAHVLALQELNKRECSDFMNCGYGHGSSVLEVIRMMEKVSGQKLEKRLVGRREGDPPQVVANPAKIKQHLGWTPRYDDLETICRTAYLWEKSLF